MADTFIKSPKGIMKYTTTIEDKAELKKAIEANSSYYYLALTWVNGVKLLQEIMDEDQGFFIQLFTKSFYGKTAGDRVKMYSYIESLTTYLNPPEELMVRIKRIWYLDLYKSENKEYALEESTFKTKPYPLDRARPTAFRVDGSLVLKHSKPLFLGLMV